MSHNVELHINTQPRLILKQVEAIELSTGGYRIVVSLATKEKVYTGEATSSDNEEEQLAATAQATLQAIIKSLYRAVDMQLAYTKQIFLANLTMVMFLVIIEIGGATSDKDLLPGACLFTELDLEVAAKATLDALNRRVGLFM